MSDKTEERVQAIANSLLTLKLVANMDEALARAREMVVIVKSSDKTVKELVSGTKELEDDFRSDVAGHEKVDDVLAKEVSALKQAVDDIKTIVKEADKVKKKKN